MIKEHKTSFTCLLFVSYENNIWYMWHLAYQTIYAGYHNSLAIKMLYVMHILMYLATLQTGLTI